MSKPNTVEMINLIHTYTFVGGNGQLLTYGLILVDAILPQYSIVWFYSNNAYEVNEICTITRNPHSKTVSIDITGFLPLPDKTEVFVMVDGNQEFITMHHQALMHLVLPHWVELGKLPYDDKDLKSLWNKFVKYWLAITEVSSDDTDITSKFALIANKGYGSWNDF